MTFTEKAMTDDQSRKLKIGARVHWKNDAGDVGIVTENTWSGVVINWDNRGPQAIMPNDMADVSLDSRPVRWCVRRVVSTSSNRRPDFRPACTVLIPSRSCSRPVSLIQKEIRDIHAW
ncbi:hypothetical protein [Tardiphaga sp. 285_C5_N1_2]|uniref:hypothetical protein n=1 Tax=Tardiphaga sp. 285_C5_N1_2 TaxID=3240775 RepID=UPI003F8C7A01